MNVRRRALAKFGLAVGSLILLLLLGEAAARGYDQAKHGMG